MEGPIIRGDQVETLLDRPYIKAYDPHYADGKHYYVASRRTLKHLVATKTDEAFRKMTPDAVSCFVVVCVKGEAPKLLLFREYRYPTGRFLLSPPAGLIDITDKATDAPALRAAAREIREETGLSMRLGDTISLINPLVFSTPGMTDESNALVSAVFHPESLDVLTQKGAEGTELFDGFCLMTEDEARETLRRGTDADGIYYSLYTWAALMWFVSGLWKTNL